MSDTREPIGFENVDDHSRARDVFAAAGYSEQGLRDTLGVGDLLEIRTIDRPAGLRRTRDGSRLATLVRLFFLGATVEAQAARHATTRQRPSSRGRPTTGSCWPQTC
jgi:hypothetical protein